MSIIDSQMGRLRARANQLLNASLSADALPFVQYTEPAGDPGYFGPDSAAWYVHSHLSSLIGLGAGGWMQALDPFMTAAFDKSGYVSSVDRVLERERRFYSFVFGTTFASKPIADRIGKMVDSQHRVVSGTTPDGRTYSASDPDTLRFAHAAFGYGFAKAHQRYHNRPLDDEGIDRYLRDYAIIGSLIGVPDPPVTMAQTMALLQDRYRFMALTNHSIQIQELMAAMPFAKNPAARKAAELFEWASFDLMPEFPQRLWRFRQRSTIDARLRRTLVYSAINAAQNLGGTAQHVLASTKRATAKPSVDDTATTASDHASSTVSPRP